MECSHWLPEEVGKPSSFLVGFVLGMRAVHAVRVSSPVVGDGGSGRFTQNARGLAALNGQCTVQAGKRRRRLSFDSVESRATRPEICRASGDKKSGDLKNRAAPT